MLILTHKYKKCPHTHKYRNAHSHPQIQKCTYSFTNTKMHIFTHKYKNAHIHSRIQKCPYSLTNTKMLIQSSVWKGVRLCMSIFVFVSEYVHFCICERICAFLYLWVCMGNFVFVSEYVRLCICEWHKSSHKARPPYKASPSQIQKCPYKICKCQTHVCGENCYKSQGMLLVTKNVFCHKICILSQNMYFVTRQEIFAHFVCVSALTFENVLQIEILTSQLTHHECMGWLRLVGCLKS